MTSTYAREGAYFGGKSRSLPPASDRMTSLPSQRAFTPADERAWPAEREEISVAVSRNTASRAWFPRWLVAMAELANLPPNWNGNGERQIHSASLKRAAAILSAIDYDGPVPGLAPRHDGTVQIEWHRGDVSIEVVVPPTGPGEAWAFDGEAEESWEATSQRGLHRLRERLGTVLHEL